MELSSEDALRLNVLLANKPLAIRINESSMTVHGLLQQGEATVRLNPTLPPEKYLKQVRSLLSERILGSPGGYPLYLQRWTRMGQMRNESLEQLLLLGDPAAVFAVVCAEGLSDELARRAWWAVEDPENARRMLQTRAVVEGETGRRLAEYLLEYLPFETEAEHMMESVRMALQPGLLDPAARGALWKKATRKGAYLVGFLYALPDALPDQLPARPDFESWRATLESLAVSGNPVAEALMRAMAGSGRTFFDTSLRILKKPANQEVVVSTLDAIRTQYRGLRPEGDPDLEWPELERDARQYAEQDAWARGVLEALPGLREEVETLRLLAGVGYGVLRPALKGSTAMGSLMRRKLEPVLDPLGARIRRLLHGPG